MLLGLFLTMQNVTAEWVAAYLRIQIMPEIVLTVTGVKKIIRRRTRGGLTGTRLASALGRIPVQDMISKREPLWRLRGFKLPCGPLTLAMYVDNLYACLRA